MPSRYTFAEYSLDWPSAFGRAAAQWRSLLGEEMVAVHHIGSTSVPGLAAKAIIDMLPLVRTIAAVDERTPLVREAGYLDWGEYGLPGRRYFTKDRAEVRTHNVHVYQSDDPAVERHLAFCAYLRRNEPARREYETLKRAVYVRYPADIEAYNDGKNAFIKQIEPLALEWYRQQSRGSKTLP